jgi:hypothetical protein
MIIASKRFSIRDGADIVYYNPGDEISEEHAARVGEHVKESSKSPEGVPINVETGAPDYDALTIPALKLLCEQRDVDLGSGDNTKARIIAKLEHADQEEMTDGD